MKSRFSVIVFVLVATFSLVGLDQVSAQLNFTFKVEVAPTFDELSVNASFDPTEYVAPTLGFQRGFWNASFGGAIVHEYNTVNLTVSALGGGGIATIGNEIGNTSKFGIATSEMWFALDWISVGGSETVIAPGLGVGMRAYTQFVDGETLVSMSPSFQGRIAIPHAGAVGFISFTPSMGFKSYIDENGQWFHSNQEQQSWFTGHTTSVGFQVVIR